MNQEHRFDWADLAFGSKRELKQLNATLIAAPREMSMRRIKQLIKTYLPKGNVVLGIAKEEFVDGFEGQPQFRTLRETPVADVAQRVNSSQSKYTVYTLDYFQRELMYILEKVPFQHVVFVNGSWKYAFHITKPYYVMAEQGVKNEFVSPFSSLDEAKEYEVEINEEIEAGLDIPETGSELSDRHMMYAAKQAATQSFDHTFQVGLSLGRKPQKKRYYTLLDTAFNRVVPRQTHAMHNGSSREKHFSPPQDLNHYDTVHAEVEMLLHAHQSNINLEGTSVFVNVMPCPVCARMLSRLEIAEVVYESDHSNGYALQLLEAAGKKIRRAITA